MPPFPAAVAVDLTGDSSDDESAASVIAEEDPTIPRTRQYMDRFHVFDSMPASRDPKMKPLLSLIRRLVIQATIEFDLDDWNDVTRFLAQHKDIADLESILDHFHFNREWWYQRVRIYPPPAAKGSDNIKLIRDFVQKNPTLKEAWSQQLEDYFDNLEQMYKDGKLAECCDVEMYQYDRKDKHGLSIWLRKRGSNRSENIHQKMRVAFGPHGVGAEVGHYLLLLVTYNYNINTGIRRRGFINFGTYRYDTIDRIQIRMMQLFGNDPFPSHTNQALFQPVQGFIAVGVGPLNYDEKYVTTGPPSTNCTGDILFLAKKMKLVGPPLHIAHPKEKKMFNDHMGEFPKPTSKTWDDLCAKYLEAADYKEVFPKLPSMLRNHYNKWKLTYLGIGIGQGHHTGRLLRFAQEIVWCGRGIRRYCYNQPSSKFPKGENNDNRQQELTEADDPDTEIAVLPDDAPENPLPVAPFAAPAQTHYIISGDNRKKDTRKCCAVTFGCTRLAKDCSRQDWKKCYSVTTKLIVVPDSEEERNIMKAAYKKKANAESEARRKTKLKAAREAARELALASL